METQIKNKIIRVMLFDIVFPLISKLVIKMNKLVPLAEGFSIYFALHSYLARYSSGGCTFIYYTQI